MTTIVTDGERMAADSMSIGGGAPINTDTQKLFAIGSSIYGHAGVLLTRRFLEAWIDKDKSPLVLRELGGSNFISIMELTHDGRIFVYTSDDPIVREEQPPFALGSGNEYALGALHADATLETAIRIASLYDEGTNTNIKVLSRFDLPTPAGMEAPDGKTTG